MGVLGPKSPPEVTKNPSAIVNFARRLGFPAEIPRLESLTAFFKEENKIENKEPSNPVPVINK